MKLEIRSADFAEVSGYINVVERYSKPLTRFKRRFIEKVKAGAFENALKAAAEEKRAIKMYADHNCELVLADTLSGTLELREDNIGLYGRAEITDRGVIEKLKTKGARGWSFGFVALKDNFSADIEGMEKRELEEINVREVSLLIDKPPAYIATSVEVRDGAEFETEYRCGEFDCVLNAEEKAKVKADAAEGYKARQRYLRNL